MSTGSAGTSKLARHAIVQGVLAIVLPIVGWIAFAIGVSVDAPDASLVGTAVALLFGGLGLLAAIAGFVLSIAELSRGSGERSRLPGVVALVLVLLAPATWVGEWALATVLFLSSMPGHIL